MDELYSNLDNYNEVNVVEELKKENRELKYKLDEYSKSMNQLQTDFNILNSEYKKLELNYSSLLKTARAEIERKTKLITNLNKEKDILIIKSMKNGQKNILNTLAQNLKREVPKKDQNKKEGDRETSNVNKSIVGVKTDTREVSRIEPHLLSPIDSVSSIGTTNKSTSSENNLRITNDKNNIESKDIILKNALDQQHKDWQIDNTKSKKITDRRKSMPVVSNWDEQFSSDEEEIGHTKRPQDYDKKNKDLSYGRTQKEQAVYDSKNKYVNERYTEKYNSYADQHQRSHRMHYRHSPERDRFKSHRGRDYSYKSDYRQRILKSPPLDKYDPNRSRSKGYRERDSEWDYDNFRVRHSSRNEYNSEDRAYLREPDLKRRRIESTSTDTERFDRFGDRKSIKHLDYGFGIYDFNHSSCQSPDYDQIESNLPQHLIKEIKNTAMIQLEDPRITSKKYLPDKTNKGCFITAVGSNMPIIPIDRSKWGLEKVEFPEALKEKALEEPTNEDLLKYIYMDVDECAHNTSANEYRQDLHKNNEKDTLVAPVTPTQNKCNKKEDLFKACHESEIYIKANDKEYKALSSHYKIPKKSKTDSNINILHKKQDTKNNIYIDNKSMKKDEKALSDDLRSIVDIQYIEQSSNIDVNNKARRLTPNKDNIAGDLELSDEASDIMDDIQISDRCDTNLKVNTPYVSQNKVDVLLKDDYKNRTVEENKHSDKNKQKVSKDIYIIKEECIKVNEIVKEKKPDNAETVQKTICNDNLDINPQNSNIHKIVIEKSPKEVEGKKKNSKKKREEKATEKIEESEKSGTPPTRKRDKKKKASKVDSDKQKQNKEEIKKSKPKNKFTELFGESSSLITPDDLGIVKYDVNTKRNDNYGSLFENTQDAIDLNVAEIQKIQNTEEIASEIGLLSKAATENDTPISYAIDNKSVFEGEEKHRISNVFKNLTPAIVDSESNVIKTVVISSGIQNIVEENKVEQTNLSEHNNNSGLANKQLPEELLRAVATSTPFKTQCDITSRLTEESSPSSESFSNAAVSLSNNCNTPTNLDGPEKNAPDVRIFLKRRRKIKKA